MVPKACGEAWRQSNRSLLLLVPSVVARMDHGVLINDGHPVCYGPGLHVGSSQPSLGGWLGSQAAAAEE